jgi:beta-lactamase class A
MIRIDFSLPLLVLLFVAQPGVPLIAQEALQKQIRDIARDAQGKVSVACSVPGTGLNCDLEAHSHPPMQSVFKLPLAVAVLHQVEQGKFSLDQPIRFRKEDLILPKPYSPLQDEYPDAGVDVPLNRLLQLTVGLSDNTAADILLRLAGGPSVVREYIASLQVKGFHLEDGERELHREVQAQYRNWFEPAGAVQLLRAISDRSPLTAQDTSLLLTWMLPATPTGRLDGALPKGTIVAHKSGTSDVDHGLCHAFNDIGLITLPDGRKLAIAVFITDSTADEATRKAVIARIGKLVYDAALRSWEKPTPRVARDSPGSLKTPRPTSGRLPQE